MKRIIEGIVVTEKSARALADNQYTFLINPEANKIEVKNFVEDYFNVKVSNVNIVFLKGKKKRQGRYEGTAKPRKKAIVTLKEGSIEKVKGLF
jgi:large subunit ribosomal protein L23